MHNNGALAAAVMTRDGFVGHLYKHLPAIPHQNPGLLLLLALRELGLHNHKRGPHLPHSLRGARSFVDFSPRAARLL